MLLSIYLSWYTLKINKIYFKLYNSVHYDSHKKYNNYNIKMFREKILK